METKIQMFDEINKHLLEDDKPSIYFNEYINKEIFKIYPFNMIEDLKNTPQSPKYHPEGSVWNHTMMVVDEAAKVKNESNESRAFMWAALLHDLGKTPTTKIRKGRITSYEHDKVGEEMAINFLGEFTKDKEFIYKVSKLVRWHMQVLFVTKDLPFSELETMVGEVKPNEIGLLALCDRLGRGDLDNSKMESEKRNIQVFLKKAHSFDVKK